MQVKLLIQYTLLLLAMATQIEQEPVRCERETLTPTHNCTQCNVITLQMEWTPARYNTSLPVTAVYSVQCHQYCVLWVSLLGTPRC